MIQLWRNLRTKLLVLFLSLLLIPVIGTGLYGYVFLSRSFLQKAIEVEQQNLNSQAEHVRAIFSEAQNALIYVSETRAVKVLSNAVPDSELYQSSLQVLRSDVQNYLLTHPKIHHLGVYNVIGEPIVLMESTADEVLLYEATTADRFASFINQVLDSPEDTTHLTVDRGANETVYNLVFAFRSGDGVVLMSLWSENLFQPGINNPISQTWSLRLPVQAVLHFALEDRDVLSPALNQHDDWLRNTRGYYVDEGNHVFYQNISIPTVQDAYTVVLFHTIPTYQLEPDLSSYYPTFGSLALGVLLCVTALALFAIDRFVKPIRQLKQSVDDIRRTQKTPALPKQLPPDEVGELSLAFYTMAIELEAKRQSERELVEKLISAQEEERKRIAYDLHDGLIQQLVGARFYLNQCKDQNESKAHEAFMHGFETLSTAISEGRRIMQGLHPSILDDLGLVEALQELSHTMGRLGNWQIDLELEQLAYEPNKSTSVTLYRIAQEALNNAYKHASAEHITVKLWQEDGIHLMIVDDGRGFDPQQMPKSAKGWGLRTMKERVSLFYGNIHIESEIGAGTIIHIWIPDEHGYDKGALDDSN